MSPSSNPLRASDADREAAVGRLRVAAMEGRLDAEELAHRVGAAYDAKWCAQLEELTADITPAALAPSGPPVFVNRGSSTNGLAIASLVLSLVWMAWLGSIAGIVFGHMALAQIRRSGGRQSGRSLALAGLALGYFGLLTLSLTIVGALLD
jgi:hypothetical protein